MKRVLFILLTLVSLSSLAQQRFPIGQEKGYNHLFGAAISDSILAIPLRDTIDWIEGKVRKFGRLTANRDDRRLYFNDSISWQTVAFLSDLPIIDSNTYATNYALITRSINDILGYDSLTTHHFIQTDLPTGKLTWGTQNQLAIEQFSGYEPVTLRQGSYGGYPIFRMYSSSTTGDVDNPVTPREGGVLFNWTLHALVDVTKSTAGAISNGFISAANMNYYSLEDMSESAFGTGLNFRLTWSGTNIKYTALQVEDGVLTTYNLVLANPRQYLLGNKKYLVMDSDSGNIVKTLLTIPINDVDGLYDSLNNRLKLNNSADVTVNTDAGASLYLQATGNSITQSGSNPFNTPARIIIGENETLANTSGTSALLALRADIRNSTGDAALITAGDTIETTGSGRSYFGYIRRYINVTTGTGIAYGFRFNDIVANANGGYVAFDVSTNCSGCKGFSQTGSSTTNAFAGNSIFGTSTTPTALLDVNGANGYSQLRLRTSYTPTGTADANGYAGTMTWDDNYIYFKTSTGYKQVALAEIE